MQLAAKAFGFFRSNYTILSVFARAQYEILLADKIPFIFSNSLLGMTQTGGSGLGKSVSKVAHASAASGECSITPDCEILDLLKDDL